MDSHACPSLEDLVLFHDSELDSPAAALVEFHARECGPCRAKLEEMQRLDQLVHAVVKHKGERTNCSLTGPSRFTLN